MTHCVETRPQNILLIVVRNAYRYPFWGQIMPARSQFAPNPRPTLSQAVYKGANYVYNFGVRSQDRCCRKLQVCPAVDSSTIEHPVEQLAASPGRNRGEKPEFTYAWEYGGAEW